MNKRDTIVDAAEKQLMSSGLSFFTVARVARAARASSALIHYHFATKQRLLLAAAERLASRRTALRLARLEGVRGLAALDALWEGLVASAARDAERAWHDLLLLAREDGDVAAVLLRERERESRALAAALPHLLADLDSRPRIPAEDLASLFATFLDGLACSLAMGADARELRGAYDAFCLALVALGQAPPAR
ncbi:MAG TPA: TetR family transcriptional regulator [Gemmatimonadales bacterium]|nr:TetR family transcriptional regulator [Gemmatimonadales bacterium]